jgi:predicted Zn-dependent peptidase
MGQTNILNKAMGLSFFEMLGDANLFNSEAERYNAITADELCQVATKVFSKNNCSTIYYLAEKNNL